MKKLVIISGGLGVLGQSFAKILAKDNYEILLLDVKKTGSKKKIVGEYFKCDIAKENDIAKLGKYLYASKPFIQGLINNASCQPKGFLNELENYHVETFKKVLEVNLLGSFLLTKMVIPFMKKQKFGSIINIGSIQGIVAPTFKIYKQSNITSPLVYSIAKSGIIHFCRWVAAKYGKWNIRCNAVSPGGVNDSQKGGSDFVLTYSSNTPLGRMAYSRDVAEAVKFLISNKSAYITGQNLVVDGGWTVH